MPLVQQQKHEERWKEEEEEEYFALNMEWEVAWCVKIAHDPRANNFISNGK